MRRGPLRDGSDPDLHRLRLAFLLASLVLGAALGAVTPPFHTPDEPGHFYRAYRVSEGRLDVVPAAGRAFATLPKSLPASATLLLDDIAFHPDRPLPAGALARAAQKPLRPRERAPVFFPESMQYTFVPYVPQAMAIAAGRLAGAGPLALLYLARTANLVVGSLAIAGAIGLLPAMRRWSALLMLTPMALAIRASASADVMTMSAAFVLVAATAALCWGRLPTTRRALALATTSAVVLCACKAPYFPLALLPLLTPRERLPVRMPGLWRSAHLALVAGAVAWGVATGLGVAPLQPEAGIDPARQIRHVAAHPLGALLAVASDLVVHAPRYASQLIGKLGWQDTDLPLALRLAFLLVLAALLVFDGAPSVRVLPRERWGLLLLVLACLGLVGLSQYLVWTPVGAPRLADGMQGRYFFPPALAGAWVFHRSRRDMAGQRWLSPALAAFALLAGAVAVAAVWRRYHG